MNFNSRETYLSEVAIWKQKYKELSSTIRKTKLEHKKLQQEGTFSYSSFLKMDNLVQQANELIQERLDSKTEAAKQYKIAHPDFVKD